MSDIQSRPSTAAGWYPDPQAPGYLRYWDGQRWGEAVHPMGVQQPQVVVVGGAGQVRSVGGMTYGQHLFHGILTLLTFGLWAPVWALLAFLGRRRVVTR